MRLLSTALLLALSGCATDSGSRAEVTDLRAQVEALRDENARLSRRVAKLEGQAAVAQARAPQAQPPRAPAEDDPGAKLPALTVVKLKPRGAAPPVDTRTPVVEPGAEVLEELSEAKGAPPSGVDEDLDPAVTEAAFERAEQALRTGNVAGGVEKLLRLADESPKHPRADNALFLAGVGLMGLDDYADAATTFERLVSRYPAGDAVVDALLKLGECRLKLQQPAEAKAAYGRVVQQYPGTAAATTARARLASLPSTPAVSQKSATGP